MTRNGLVLVAAVSIASVAALADDEKPLSGPQVGERLPPLRVLGVYDDDAGREFDLVARSDGKPTMLIFVHGVTRPSMAFARILSRYADSRAKDGLKAGIVWLAADRSEAEQYLRRVRQSLNLKVPVGISLDGAEGPGSYGLNRNVTLTILVAQDSKVTANFAFVQPSTTETPNVLAAVVKLIGGNPPTLAELEAADGRSATDRPKAKDGNSGRGIQDGNLRELLRPLINKDADPDAVKKAATAVEAYVGTDAAKQRDLGQAAQLIVSLKYGTPAAQEQLRAWAEKYGSKENRDQ